MKFNFSAPTELLFGAGAISDNSGCFKRYGSKALVVTGRHSAKLCGALHDVTDTLDKENIAYRVFDQVENNPSIETVEMAAAQGAAFGAQMIVGIGGGSPIDAGKAVAVLCANPEMHAADLFLNRFKKALPLLAVPTTAGTGSEATPYSVLLVKDKETKLSFGSALTQPKCAFLDPRYTLKLGEAQTINTAVDAFTHAFEGYLARRSSPLSACLSLEAMRIFGECLPELEQRKFSGEMREKMLYASALGGVIIAQTGVTIAHGMGYCFTFFKGIPHGRANGLLMDAYIRLNRRDADCAKKIDKAAEVMGLDAAEAVSAAMRRLLGPAVTLTSDEAARYTKLTLMQKGSIANNPYPLDKAAIRGLWDTFRAD